jgi:hypothetical protein
MLNWLRRRSHIPVLVADRSVSPRETRPPPLTGKYALLYKYLENRYAETVVLTFAQIEDLIGFRLPDQASRQTEWWTAEAPTEASSHSQAWTLASRTASPNLMARTVAFDRPV